MLEDIGVTATLYGRFSIKAVDGRELTPKGMKSQGLLAILLSSKGGTRSRVWLQDKLWSDRGQEQGAGSLRQSLSEIRRSFGPHQFLLKADRRFVSLDLDRISTTSTLEDREGEFLEGLDVRDPEFEDWLRVKRMEAAQLEVSTPSQEKKPSSKTWVPAVFLKLETDVPGPFAITESLFADLVAKSLREFTAAETYYSAPPRVQDGLLIVSIQGFSSSDTEFGLRVSVTDVNSQRCIWSEFKLFQACHSSFVENVELLALSNQLVGVLVDQIVSDRCTPNSNMDANLLSSLAIGKIFSMRQGELADAERLLSEAYDIERRGLFQAWLAQLFAIQFVERCTDDREELKEKANECSAYALEFEPNNSFVLAAIANARRVFDKNFIQSGELATMAVRANPANPLAWWSLSAAKLYCGDEDGAYESAVNAQLLARGSKFKFWGDFQRSLTAAATGRMSEAIRFGEASHALAPNFRPPMRYLTALYASNGFKSAAEGTARKLLQQENDFSIDRLVCDPDYPVSLMRNKGLLDKRQLLDLELD